MMIDVPNGVEQLPKCHLIESIFNRPVITQGESLKEKKPIIEWIVSRSDDVMKSHFDIFSVYCLQHSSQKSGQLAFKMCVWLFDYVTRIWIPKCHDSIRWNRKINSLQLKNTWRCEDVFFPMNRPCPLNFQATYAASHKEFYPSNEVICVMKGKEVSSFLLNKPNWKLIKRKFVVLFAWALSDLTFMRGKFNLVHVPPTIAPTFG